MDLRDVAVAAIDDVIGSGVVEEAIRQAIEKAVVEVVTRELRSHSDFGGQLTEAVRSTLKLNEGIDLPSYNDAILKVVRAQVEHHTNAVIQQQVAESISELLTVAPEQIALSELVSQYVEEVRGQASRGCVCYGEAYGVSVYLEDSSTSGFKTLHLHDEPDTPSRECEIHVGLHMRTADAGEVYHLRFANGDVERQMFVGPFHGFERLLFQMRAAKTRVVLDVDVDELETSYEVEYA